MLTEAVSSQFAHVAQDDHLAGHVHHAEVGQGSLHGGGVGVVGIHDKAVTARIAELAAAVGGNVGSQGFVNIRSRHSEVESHGDGGTEVGHIVGSHEVGLHPMPGGVVVLTPLYDEQRRTVLYPALHVGHHLKGGRSAHEACPTLLGHLPKVIVEGVEEDSLVAECQVVIEFSLGTLHSIKGTEALKVGTSHIGDESKVGLHDAAQEGYLAGMVGSRLDDSHLMLGTDAQQGERHPDVVVEVTLGEEGAEAAAQHGTHQFLRRCLAVGAGNLQHRDRELTAVPGGKLLEGCQHIINQDVAAVALHGVGSLIHDGVRATRLKRRGSKAVTIKSTALEGKEQGTGFHLTVVGGDDGVPEVYFVELFHCLFGISFNCKNTQILNMYARRRESFFVFEPEKSKFCIFVLQRNHIFCNFANIDTKQHSNGLTP